MFVVKRSCFWAGDNVPPYLLICYLRFDRCGIKNQWAIRNVRNKECNPVYKFFIAPKSPGIMHVSRKTTRCSVKRTLPAPWTHTTNGGNAFVNWVTPFTNLSGRNNWTPSWKKSSIWRKQWWTASKKVSSLHPSTNLYLQKKQELSNGRPHIPKTLHRQPCWRMDRKSRIHHGSILRSNRRQNKTDFRRWKRQIRGPWPRVQPGAKHFQLLFFSSATNNRWASATLCMSL